MSVYFAASSQIPLKTNDQFHWLPFTITIQSSYTAYDYRKDKLTDQPFTIRQLNKIAYLLSHWVMIHREATAEFIQRVYIEDGHKCVSERETGRARERERERETGRARERETEHKRERDRASKRERDRVSKRERDRVSKREDRASKRERAYWPYAEVFYINF